MIYHLYYNMLYNTCTHHNKLSAVSSIVHTSDLVIDLSFNLYDHVMYSYHLYILCNIPVLNNFFMDAGKTIF